MARKVEIEWTSKDEQVARTLQRTEQGMEALLRKMDKVESASKKAAHTTETGFEKATKKIAGMASALIGGGSLLTAVDMVRRANEEMIRQADEAAKKYDELFRKFRVVAGLSALETEQAKKSIVAAAERTATTTEVATAGSIGLVGAGFSAQDSSGRALEVLLSAQKGYAQKGIPLDTENLAKQAAAYFASQGMESTPENLQTLLENAFALRAGSFELTDFQHLGRQGSVFQGKMSQREQLAAFGTLVDATMDPAGSATALRNVVLKLTAGGRTTDEALSKIGLDRTATDLIGEDFGTALDRISAGLQTLPEEEREPVLKKLFEESGVSPAKLLMAERRGKYARYQAGMAVSADELAAATSVGMGGINAAAIRQKVRADDRFAALSQNDDLYRMAIEESLIEQGYSPVNRLFGRGIYESVRGLGGSQDLATQLGYGSMLGTNRETINEATRSAREQLRSDMAAPPARVEVVNPNGGPAVQQNRAAGFGR